MGFVIRVVLRNSQIPKFLIWVTKSFTLLTFCSCLSFTGTTLSSRQRRILTSFFIFFTLCIGSWRWLCKLWEKVFPLLHRFLGGTLLDLSRWPRSVSREIRIHWPELRSDLLEGKNKVWINKATLHLTLLSHLVSLRPWLSRVLRVTSAKNLS